MTRAKHSIFIAFMLLVLIIGLSGCKNGEGAPQDITQPFVGGDGGIAISFVEGMPPETVYDAGQYPFSMDIRMTNAGEADVGVLDTYYQNPDDPYPNLFGQVRIIGLLPLSWGNPPPMIVKDFVTEGIGLRGSERQLDGAIVEGETRDILFTGFNYQDDNVGNTQTTFRAELCYDYSTQAVGQLCFADSVLQGSAGDSLCNVNQEILPQNSGAPVQVTAMKQNAMGPNTISLTFEVSHVGKGKVFARDNPALFPDYQFVSPIGQQYIPCDTNPAAQRNRNQVWARVYFKNPNLADSMIRCANFNGANQGVVQMLQEASVPVMCTIQVPAGMGAREFSQLINIDLKYRYLETIQRDLVVQDVTIG